MEFCSTNSQLIATFDHHTVHSTDEDIYKDHLQVVFSLRDRVQALVTNCIFSLITALCFIPILNDYLLFIWIAKPTFPCKSITSNTQITSFSFFVISALASLYLDAASTPIKSYL